MFVMRAQDLLQYKDRDRWYLPTIHADDAPDWNAGRFLRSRQLAPGIREASQLLPCTATCPALRSTRCRNLSSAVPSASSCKHCVC